MEEKNGLRHIYIFFFFSSAGNLTNTSQYQNDSVSERIDIAVALGCIRVCGFMHVLPFPIYSEQGGQGVTVSLYLYV